MKLIECVPNFSEGRDLAVVTAIRDAIAAVPGASILHVTADASHNRSVITFVASYDAIVEAAFAGIRVAREKIDISQHSGVHPRIGAADVVPFVPLDGATMDDCIIVARLLGERVGRELEIPVYLYERAATRESRRNLADVRGRGFEALREDIVTNPERAPDFGPARVHPTFGAVAIGARPFLVAFNAYVGDATQLPIAKAIAKAVRASNGGLPAVKALGFEVDGQAQVSMNLVDLEQTSLATAYDVVRAEARSRGVDVTWSEIIGLVPEQALLGVAASHLRLRQSVEEHVLERRLLELRSTGQTVDAFFAAIASGAPTPGGGTAAAHTGALAAALVVKCARLTIGRARYADVQEEMEDIAGLADGWIAHLSMLATQDAEAYAAVMDARARKEGVQAALLHAAEVPRETAWVCANIALFADTVADCGNHNAMTDAETAGLLARAACRAAVANVRINANALDDRDKANDLYALTEQYVALLKPPSPSTRRA